MEFLAMLARQFRAVVAAQSLFLRDLIRGSLNQVGIKDIGFARDGAEAIWLLRQQPTHLVVADAQMEPLSGLHLLATMQDDRDLKDTPVILLSSHGTAESVAAAKRAGAAGYLLMPFAPRHLARQIVCVVPDLATAARGSGDAMTDRVFPTRMARSLT